ncbi:MAG: response regulator transcription factor [Lachnospiraceae bacterium]|nr:response regulator transcription factor [Lachnospiraceae bacterium]
MNIMVLGQDADFTRQLAALCKKENIHLYSEKYTNRKIQLLVTDFSMENAGKGIYDKIPFLVISKENREEKILEAFSKGAEDYMIYPVSPEIAKARIQRVLKSYASKEVFPENIYADIHFTPNEYKILSSMMQSPGKVFTRSELIEEALSVSYEGFDRNIDNYMKQIRRKIEKSTGESEHIQTVYGMGYRYRI